jgi:hypothetical protein
MANMRVDQLKSVQTEALELFRRKNQDYGDAFATYGTVGVLVRMGDKIMRLQNITNRGTTLVDDEKLRDTLIDLHNYAGMAVMLLDETTETIKDPVLEDNNEQTVSWGIYGSKGEVYTRTQTRLNGKVIRETCTCPAFKYSKNGTCKHILDTSNNFKCVDYGELN